MELESVLVTGANRGIGLEFVKQLVKLQKPPRFIFSTFRNENTVQALEKIKEESKETEIVLIKMDVRDAEDIERAGNLIEEKVGDNGLNLLINNAGVLIYQSFDEITEEDMLFHYRINTVAPVMILKRMLPLLQKASSRKTGGMSVSRAAVLNISALLGSITELTEDYPKRFLSAMSYRASSPEHGHEGGCPHSEGSGDPYSEHVSWLGENRHGNGRGHPRASRECLSYDEYSIAA
ncbi:unnamed protein product [Larinioides sclopetarius]|uniref:Uncharacterized protein n=1 Tax=Larinioides sclopetarius TaxID=280406 RepID=A0AAV2BKK6_9ARAC